MDWLLGNAFKSVYGYCIVSNEEGAGKQTETKFRGFSFDCGHIFVHFGGFYKRNEFIWGFAPGRPPLKHIPMRRGELTSSLDLSFCVYPKFQMNVHTFLPISSLDKFDFPGNPVSLNLYNTNFHILFTNLSNQSQNWCHSIPPMAFAWAHWDKTPTP